MKIFSSIALAALASAPTATLAQAHDGEFPWLYERKILVKKRSTYGGG